MYDKVIVPSLMTVIIVHKAVIYMNNHHPPPKKGSFICKMNLTLAEKLFEL